MEISEHELGRLVAHADDEHRASLPTLVAHLAEVHLSRPDGARTDGTGPDGAGPEPSGGTDDSGANGGNGTAEDPSADRGGRSRRQVLRAAAAGGIAVTLGTAVLPVAGWASPAAAADAPPPTDAEIVAFAESLERALTAVYSEAAASPVITIAAVRTAFTTFAGHHQQHAAAFAALGGRVGATSNHQPNVKMLDVGRGQLRAARDTNHALDLGFLLESSATSTYMVALGSLKGAEVQRLTASILPVESQHAAAFGVARGMAVADLIPTFITVDRAIDPAKYPAA